MMESQQTNTRANTKMTNMVVLAWNCRGLGNVNSMGSARDLIDTHHPDIFIITETRMNSGRAEEVANRLHFGGFAATETIGLRGGILLLWNKEELEVSIIGSTEQEIHAIIQVKKFNYSWLCSAIYASPRLGERLLLWNNLEKVAESNSLPWLAMGDFNEIACEEEKFGGTSNAYRIQRFNEMLDYCNLLDLGFKEPKFTWTNLRQVGGLIQERLDRAVANEEWSLSYPNAEVWHLARAHSDHSPILLNTNPLAQSRKDRPFRFEPMWMRNPLFPKLVEDSWGEGQHYLPVAINCFQQNAKIWNKNVFGDLFF